MTAPAAGRRRTRRRAGGLIVLLAVSCLAAAQAAPAPQAAPAAQAPVESCFLLFELGTDEVRRRPAEACGRAVTPASTFKVPHALAALDAGVVSGAEERIAYDGTGSWPESARRDHTLASAIRHSVVWYFQRVAERLGAGREQMYLRRLAFGNQDPSSGLTTFWIGGSLLVTPEEQAAFWMRLYENRLPVAASAVQAVKAALVQPHGSVVNAAGEQPFGGPWPAGAVVSAKTGSATDRSGRGVRWLAGHVARGGRSWVFVSCVIGPRDVAATAAIDLAAGALREAGVL
jgi:beta-lactamase class D